MPVTVGRIVHVRVVHKKLLQNCASTRPARFFPDGIGKPMMLPRAIAIGTFSPLTRYWRKTSAIALRAAARKNGRNTSSAQARARRAAALGRHIKSAPADIGNADRFGFARTRRRQARHGAGNQAQTFVDCRTPRLATEAIGSRRIYRESGAAATAASSSGAHESSIAQTLHGVAESADSGKMMRSAAFDRRRLVRYLVLNAEVAQRLA